jgi:hypothetical protein
MESPVFASAYDAESGLRLVRLRGRWDMVDFSRIALQDPTLAHLADAVTVADLRGVDMWTSPGDVEQLASNRRQHAESPFEDRYAFVVDSPTTAGTARLFGRMVGAGRIQVFESVEAALAHFDLGFDAYLRAEKSLQPVAE